MGISGAERIASLAKVSVVARNWIKHTSVQIRTASSTSCISVVIYSSEHGDTERSFPCKKIAPEMQ